jgi:hypothetical protein
MNAILAKLNLRDIGPLKLQPGLEIQIQETASYGLAPALGTDAYIWTSETPRKGPRGIGLAALGDVQRVSSDRLTIRLKQILDKRVFGNQDLAQHRNDKTNWTLYKIAQKIYAQSHTKVVELSADEVSVLEDKFK